MVGWSVRRRFAYFILTALALTALFAGSYLYFKPPPACTDGRQNGDELGVDCGGSCPRVCPLEIQDLKVLWSRVLKVAPGRYDLVAVVENPNPRHGIQSLRYKLDVLDADNLLINVVTGQTLVNPQESAVIFRSQVAVGERVPARAVFDFAEPPAWRRVERTMPRLRLSNQQFSALPTPRLTALVTNDSLVDLKGITVVALLSDDDGNTFAASSTFVEFLDAGQGQELAFTWPAPFEAAPAFIDLYPHFDLTQVPAP